MAEPLLEAKGLCLYHDKLLALDNVSLDIMPGETLALVGPSGSGKSTLARAILRLYSLQSGSIRFEGEDWLAFSGSELRKRRAKMQMVFQEPLTAFNPRSLVHQVLDDPLRIHKLNRDVFALMDAVGLDRKMLQRRMHEISGGQRQRVAIARALATRPSLIVLDEAVSALDVAIRNVILDLLRNIQQRDGTAFLFITHDLAIASKIATQIAVMDQGKIVECQPAGQLITAPKTQIAKALIDAVPRMTIRAKV